VLQSVARQTTVHERRIAQSALAAERHGMDTVLANREVILKFEIPQKFDRALLQEIFMECLALLGVCSLAGVLALAMRVFEGKW
jgi:hypothetical protein